MSIYFDAPAFSLPVLRSLVSELEQKGIEVARVRARAVGPQIFWLYIVVDDSQGNLDRYTIAENKKVMDIVAGKRPAADIGPTFADWLEVVKAPMRLPLGTALEIPVHWQAEGGLRGDHVVPPAPDWQKEERAVALLALWTELYDPEYQSGEVSGLDLTLEFLTLEYPKPWPSAAEAAKSVESEAEDALHLIRVIHNEDVLGKVGGLPRTVRQEIARYNEVPQAKQWKLACKAYNKVEAEANEAIDAEMGPDEDPPRLGVSALLFFSHFGIDLDFAEASARNFRARLASVVSAHYPQIKALLGRAEGISYLRS